MKKRLRGPGGKIQISAGIKIKTNLGGHFCIFLEMSFTAADDSESFSSFSEDEDNSQFVHGLSHVRRLEQENENCLSNLSKELKLLSKFVHYSFSLEKSIQQTPKFIHFSFLGEPASKRRKIDKESLTESFMEILPRKCGKSAVKRTKNNLFQNLSDEVIVKIFSYLNRQSLGRTASVCQRYSISKSIIFI